METALIATLPRQSGLMREMQIIANNIANADTTGFRREGLVFSEHVRATGAGPSVSLAHANARHLDLTQGGLTQTGAPFDLAIEGEGFFLIATPQGDRLTRAGQFQPGPAGDLLTPDGYPLLDEGGAPVAVPPGARAVLIGQDGTLTADGQPVARIGLWRPTDPGDLRHEAGTRLAAAGGVEPVEDGRIRQGALESSNVDPVQEIARMIEVQRAYEMGQSLMDREDARLRGLIETLGR
ncbi:MAG: flagellar hook-basal body complex protein [Rhodobacterales bacterium]|nr:flagellar hook-basal body complex protein [Rhodobacterales bacterium]